jgi:hypothetical protein
MRIDLGLFDLLVLKAVRWRLKTGIAVKQHEIAAEMGMDLAHVKASFAALRRAEKIRGRLPTRDQKLKINARKKVETAAMVRHRCKRERAAKAARRLYNETRREAALTVI